MKSARMMARKIFLMFMPAVQRTLRASRSGADDRIAALQMRNEAFAGATPGAERAAFQIEISSR